MHSSKRLSFATKFIAFSCVPGGEFPLAQQAWWSFRDHWHAQRRTASSLEGVWKRHGHATPACVHTRKVKAWPSSPARPSLAVTAAHRGNGRQGQGVGEPHKLVALPVLLNDLHSACMSSEGPSSVAPLTMPIQRACSTCAAGRGTVLHILWCSTPFSKLYGKSCSWA